MPQPGKALQVDEPVIHIAIEGKGRGPAGFDPMAGQKIFALHHLDDGLGIGRAEFGEPGHESGIARSRPRPGEQGMGHQPVCQTEAR